MLYNVIGFSSFEKPNLAFIQLQETGGKWSFEIIHTDPVELSTEWQQTLAGLLPEMSVQQYMGVHVTYARYMGEQINAFIEKYTLDHKIHLISFDGNIVLNDAENGIITQLGDGATLAAITQLPVVTDLFSMNAALGGHGTLFNGNAQKLLQDVVGNESVPSIVAVALMGVLRWREEYNMLAEATGASRSSINGALWLGVEA